MSDGRVRVDYSATPLDIMRRTFVQHAGERAERFPTAGALLAAWEKPWATRINRFAINRLTTMYRLGFDVMELPLDCLG